jgi:hypothetical protein
VQEGQEIKSKRMFEVGWKAKFEVAKRTGLARQDREMGCIKFLFCALVLAGVWASLSVSVRVQATVDGQSGNLKALRQRATGAAKFLSQRI